MLLAALNELMASCLSVLPLRKQEDGQDMVEYALLVGLLTLGTIAVVVLVGPYLKDTFQYVVNGLASA